MRLIDSHCHLQDAKFAEDREDVIARALDVLEACVVIGDDIPTSEAGIALTRPGVYATAGIHPYWADTANDDAMDRLRTLLAGDFVVALGEIGLDYFKHCTIPKETQFEAFHRQLALAAELNLPVVIHNREADNDTGDVLEQYVDRLPPGVMHCFGGTADFAERCLEWGWYVSFAGNVTFPKAEELREAAKRVPLDQLLVETDAPYLAPQPVRGKRCEPQFVTHTAAHLAELYDVPVLTLTGQTNQNTRRLYGLNERVSTP